MTQRESDIRQVTGTEVSLRFRWRSGWLTKDGSGAWEASTDGHGTVFAQRSGPRVRQAPPSGWDWWYGDYHGYVPESAADEALHVIERLVSALGATPARPALPSESQPSTTPTDPAGACS